MDWGILIFISHAWSTARSSGRLCLLEMASILSLAQWSIYMEESK